jgi:arylsulfatase A-like enzyme
LDDTLIIWMGEFGRSPRTNNNGGRDHFHRAWTSMLMGGGIKGGQIIGKTDGTGSSVVDRPISVYDLMASVCKILGINGAKEINTPIGRPIRLVDKSGVAIEELFG